MFFPSGLYPNETNQTALSKVEDLYHHPSPYCTSLSMVAFRIQFYHPLRENSLRLEKMIFSNRNLVQWFSALVSHCNSRENFNHHHHHQVPHTEKSDKIDLGRDISNLMGSQFDNHCLTWELPRTAVQKNNDLIKKKKKKKSHNYSSLPPFLPYLRIMGMIYLFLINH